MNLINLRPTPSSLPDDFSGAPQAQQVGFVDDEVVFSLLAGPRVQRQQGNFKENLALVADDLDYAGWCLKSELPSRATETFRPRPAPPVMDEPWIGDSHQGSQRWWLAGMAGALSTLLISLLLLSLSERTASPDENLPVVYRAQRAKATPVVEKETAWKFNELTEAPMVK